LITITKKVRLPKIKDTERLPGTERTIVWRELSARRRKKGTGALDARTADKSGRYIGPNVNLT